MTPHRRLASFGLFVSIYAAGVLGIVASGGRPPAATYSPYTPPSYSQSRPSCPPDVDETRPHMAVRLVEVTPPITLPTQRVVTIDRRYTEKSSALISSCSTTRSSQYTGNGIIILADREIQFAFGFSSLDLSTYDAGGEIVSSAPLGLSLVVRNASARGITLDWNAVALIDATGKAYGVIHRGVKMADRSSIRAPSTIPPGATLEDFVYPNEGLHFSASRYGSSWIGIQFFERMRPPQRFKLYLPVKHGSDTVEYQFVFEALVAAVSERPSQSAPPVKCSPGTYWTGTGCLSETAKVAVQPAVKQVPAAAGTSQASTAPMGGSQDVWVVGTWRSLAGGSGNVDGPASFEFRQRGSQLAWRMTRKGWISGIQTTQEASGSVTRISDSTIELEGKYDLSNLGNVVGQPVRYSFTRVRDSLQGYEVANDGTKASLLLRKQ